jgi:hypothetical protein
MVSISATILKARQFYYLGTTPSALRYKNWKFYWETAQSGSPGQILPPQNIKRDPFEQFVAQDQKTITNMGTATGDPVTARQYDTSLLRIREQIVNQHLETYATFPPLSAPSSYNLDQTLDPLKQVASIRPDELESYTPDFRIIPVLYATNRVVTRTQGGGILEGVTYRRSPELTFGVSLIRVPEKHELGNIERPFPFKLTVFGFTLWRSTEKDTEHFVLRQVTTLSKDEFVEVIKRNEMSTALLFIHGYYNNFADTLFTLAQITWDTQFKGVPVAFSWPSKGELLGYDYDRDSARYYVDALLRVLNLLQTDASIKKVFVVAHSM